MERTGHIVTISIETTNAAFDEDEAIEVARILRVAAETVKRHGIGEGQRISLGDLNGNTLGYLLTTGA